MFRKSFTRGLYNRLTLDESDSILLLGKELVIKPIHTQQCEGRATVHVEVVKKDGSKLVNYIVNLDTAVTGEVGSYTLYNLGLSYQDLTSDPVLTLMAVGPITIDFEVTIPEPKK